MGGFVLSHRNIATAGTELFTHSPLLWITEQVINQVVDDIRPGTHGHMSSDVSWRRVG